MCVCVGGTSEGGNVEGEKGRRRKYVFGDQNDSGDPEEGDWEGRDVCLSSEVTDERSETPRHMEGKCLRV